MKIRLAVIVAGLGLLLSAGPALAHHAFCGGIRRQETYQVDGYSDETRVVESSHLVYIDVKDDNGKVTNWGFEMGSPNILLRAGWTRNSMNPGDVVTSKAVAPRTGATTRTSKWSLWPAPVRDCSRLESRTIRPAVRENSIRPVFASCGFSFKHLGTTNLPELSWGMILFTLVVAAAIYAFS